MIFVLFAWLNEAKDVVNQGGYVKVTVPLLLFSPSLITALKFHAICHFKYCRVSVSTHGEQCPEENTVEKTKHLNSNLVYYFPIYLAISIFNRISQKVEGLFGKDVR